MKKVSGAIKDFALVRDEGSRIVVCYGYTAVDEKNATWYEIYFYTKKGKPSFEQVKQAIIKDINGRTDEKILSGFVWNDTMVWLNRENQFNYKAAYDLAIQTQGASLPVTFKFGTDAEPVYHTFGQMEEFTDFYTRAIGYINATLAEGWQKKDSFDFSVYEPFFPHPETPVAE